MTNTHHIMQRDARSGSFEAAVRQTKGKRAELYNSIMDRLSKLGPMTDAEILRRVADWHDHPVTPSGVRSRRNELVLAGWVTELRDDDGAPVKKRNANGSPCQVWRAVTPDEEHEPPKPTRRAKGAMLGDESTPEHEAGLAVARRYAAWHIGDPAWAQFIIEAYLDPAGAADALDEDGAP